MRRRPSVHGNGLFHPSGACDAGGAHGQPAWNGDAGQQNRYFDYFVARSRMVLTVDTRTATEYGVVRTFGSVKLSFTTLGGSTFNPNSINTSLPVGSANLLDTPGGGYAAVYDLFIQFAGFTFGKSASAYASPWQGNPATTRPSCWAAIAAMVPAPTTSSTRRSSATASLPASVSTIRPVWTRRLQPVDGAERDVEHGQRLCRRSCA